MATLSIKAGTIVRLRESRSGRVTEQKALVMGTQPPDAFSRAYGRQVYYCTFFGKEAHVATTGAQDLYPIGRARRVPAVCKQALLDYEATYPQFARRKRRG
jgi:hypothetical protein